MGALGNLIPLIIVLCVVGVATYMGYQVYVWSNDLASRGMKSMQDKNVTFTKDGMRVGVKQLSEEDYAAKQQSLLVNTWNLSSFPAYKSWLWNKDASSSVKSAKSAVTPNEQFNGHSSARSPQQGTMRSPAIRHTELDVPSARRPGSGGSSPGAFPDSA